ncbi:MAG TPA: gamma-glutamyl-gamma-aminobutyrate hydrolase family protein [Acidimicrobiales bacterium]|nr:gamma-glutamyl-gamma-aminobutyrate hydrolase family protein [Acidimicrobiales bacterium]
MANSDAPLVAVPASWLAPGRIEGWRAGAYAVGDTYLAALRRAGARPVVLTGPEPEPSPELLAPFAGLVLAGGGDVDPAHYASWRDDRVYGVEPERDHLELALVRAGLEAGIPILAICRGAQVVNVAFGGTLHQHLPGALGRGAHGDPTSGVLVTHGVDIAPSSRLAAAVASDRLSSCTSIHHQGIERLGDGLMAVGWSDDGLVEALEPAEGDGWLVAVQWHPEITAADDPGQQALFNAFTREARRCAALV